MPWSYQAQRQGWLVRDSQGPPFLSFLKMGVIVAFFQSLGDFTWVPLLLKYDREWDGNYICQFPQDHWFSWIYIHSSFSIVSNLIFCDGWEFILPIPALRLFHFRGLGRAIANKIQGKYFVEYLILPWVSCHNIPYLTYPRVQFLLCSFSD